MSPKNNNSEITLLIDAPSKEKDGGTLSVLRRIVLEPPTMACIAPLKSSHGQRRTLEESNIGPPNRVFKHDAPKQRYNVKYAATVLIDAGR
jgi:hypothetical protein